jgi:hypothetical protein
MLGERLVDNGNIKGHEQDGEKTMMTTCLSGAGVADLLLQP